MSTTDPSATLDSTASDNPSASEVDRDRYLRALAEIDNLRKRKEQEIVQTRDQAKADALVTLLPIIDNLERALRFALEGDTPDSLEKLRAGIKLVVDNARHILEQIGVEGFDTEGKVFIAQVMDAVAEIPTNRLPPSTVAVQFDRGYMLNGQLLRPARVGVAVADEKEKPE